MWRSCARAAAPTARPIPSRPAVQSVGQQRGPVMWRRRARAPVPTAQPIPSKPAAQSVAPQWMPVTWRSRARERAPTAPPTGSSLTAPPVMTATPRPATTTARRVPAPAAQVRAECGTRRRTRHRPLSPKREAKNETSESHRGAENEPFFPCCPSVGSFRMNLLFRSRSDRET